MTEEKYKEFLNVHPEHRIVPSTGYGYQQTPLDYIPTILKILEIFDIDISKSSFIDLGCGFGILMQHMKDLGFKSVHGIEFNKSMKKKTVELLPEIASKIKYTSAETVNPTIYDVMYTFNIMESNTKRKWFFKIINEMKPGQVLIESYDWQYDLLHAINNLRQLPLLYIKMGMFTAVKKIKHM